MTCHSHRHGPSSAAHSSLRLTIPICEVGRAAESGTMVLLFAGEGKERVEVASCVPRIGKPQRGDLRGPKIDLQWMLNEFLDEK
jgi:hypothetical protein